MLLEQQLKEDMKQALKAREAGKKRLSVLRMALAAAKNKQIELKHELSEEQWLEVIAKEVKQRRNSIAEYRKAGRDDIVQELEQEIEVLESYLPQQLAEEEIKRLAQETIAAVGAETKKDMGKVMGALMPKVKGKADGKLVNKIVSELIH